jgi:DNA (cytosine-5)-methyltransferase 1
VTREEALDLFCGEGGTSRGLADAGYQVTGVDIAPQPRYPYPMAVGGALEYLAAADLAGVALITASPPCPRYARPTLAAARSRHPDLVAPVRAALAATGLPWVMENVPGAPMAAAATLDGTHAITLCGCMFGLTAWWPKGGQRVALYRERLFESSHPLPQPPHRPHVLPSVSVNRRGGRFNGPGDHHNRSVSLEVCQRLMRMPWTSQSGLGNAIPPAYTEHIGRQLLGHLAERAA